MVKRRRLSARGLLISAIGGGLMLSAIPASSSDFIGVFAEEGGDGYQAVTEIKLENGEVITVVYSQGGFQYLPQNDAAPESDDAISIDGALITLSNPQMSQHFIPGLFGYTAAGGPEVDQNQKVAEASQSDENYKENRKAHVGTAISTSFVLDQAKEVGVSQDFLPLHARRYHVNSFSR